MITAALLLLQYASLLQSQFERISPQAAATRLSQCGLGTVTIRQDDELQEEVLVPSAGASATNAQLACADKVVSFYTLDLPPDVQRRFAAIRDARLKPVMIADAKSDLARRGLLDRLPEYYTGKTDDGAFVKQLEKLCGPAATGALTSSFGPHIISGDWIVRGRFSKPHLEALACITNAALVRDFELGFIGNEAY